MQCEHKLRSWRFLPECGFGLFSVWILYDLAELLLTLYLAITGKALQPDTLHGMGDLPGSLGASPL